MTSPLTINERAALPLPPASARCDKPGCGEAAIAHCDPCGNGFCEDHGTRSRMLSCGETALCFDCNGYDADGE